MTPIFSFICLVGVELSQVDQLPKGTDDTEQRLSLVAGFTAYQVDQLPKGTDDAFAPCLHQYCKAVPSGPIAERHG